MSIVKFPAKNPASKLASMVGDHVAVRVPDFEQAVKWYVEKLDFRVVHQWPFTDEKLAYLAPATDDNFTLELLAWWRAEADSEVRLHRSRRQPAPCGLPPLLSDRREYRGRPRRATQARRHHRV
jgi:catechol 2,3-dioxygenase-like lactoylglutathione lyase family enzyme